MGATVDEYTALEARVNHNGSVDVLVDGSPVPAGTGLSMGAVLELLTRYASENGKLLMTTTHPNGSVTRDLVSETGEVTPFYPEAKPNPVNPTAGRSAGNSHEDLYRELRKNTRRVVLADIAAEPVHPVAPATTRVKLGEGSIPTFDVEADIKKALSASNPPRSTAKTTLIAVIIAVAILGGLAAAGWMYFTGYDFRGPLPTSAPAIAGVLRL